jgi:SAM-dependent methyltransferase
VEINENFAEKQERWKKYNLKKARIPNKDLVKYFSCVLKKDRALDLGAGNLRDSIFMAENGFDKVVSLDIMKEPVFEIEHDSIEFVSSKFEDFNYGKERYDLVNSRMSISFIPKEYFFKVLSNISDSLNRGGVLIIDFFGNNHGFKKSDNVSESTFVSKEELTDFLKDFEIISFNQRDEDSKTFKNGVVRWHSLDFVLRKK